jgi:hypothetical protein
LIGLSIVPMAPLERGGEAGAAGSASAVERVDAEEPAVVVSQRGPLRREPVEIEVMEVALDGRVPRPHERARDEGHEAIRREKAHLGVVRDEGQPAFPIELERLDAGGAEPGDDLAMGEELDRIAKRIAHGATHEAAGGRVQKAKLRYVIPLRPIGVV